MSKEDKDMATVEAHLRLDAFKEMKRLLKEGMRSQGLTPEDIKKEIELSRNEK